MSDEDSDDPFAVMKRNQNNSEVKGGAEIQVRQAPQTVTVIEPPKPAPQLK